MPVPPTIAGAAGEFTQNTGAVQKAVAGLTPEQWLSRPSDHSNHIAWIVGHVIWARQTLINRVGGQWPCPGLEAFARSAKLDESATYPTPEALLALLNDSATALDTRPERSHPGGAGCSRTPRTAQPGWKGQRLYWRAGLARDVPRWPDCLPAQLARPLRRLWLNLRRTKRRATARWRWFSFGLR